MSKMRNIAAILGRTEAANIDNSPGVDIDDNIADSSVVSSILAGSTMAVYSSVDSLPGSPTAGSQAFVTGNQRLYTARNSAVGSGWYNVALINATPTLSLSASGTIALASDGTATTITMTAADSDNSNANLALTLESGGDLFKFAKVSQDSSVVTITPRSEDSANTLGSDGSATLTFKASDGISQATVQNTFTLAFSLPEPNWAGSVTEYLYNRATLSLGQSGTYNGQDLSFSFDGNYVISGHCNETTSGSESGAAYIVKKNGASWANEATLKASDPQASAQFGRGVALNEDGTYAAVGAWAHDTNAGASGAAHGKVYIFTRSGSTWSQQTSFVSQNDTAEFRFGWRVRLDATATRVFISSRYDSSNSGGYAEGAVYVYKRTGSSWAYEARLNASDGAAWHTFGYDIATNSAGDYLVATAPSLSSSAGAVYVFTRSGTTWTQQVKLTEPGGATSNNRFGASIDINNDASYMVIGADQAPYSGNNYGKIYVYTRSGTSWTNQAGFQPSSGATGGDYNGYHVRINDSGTHVATTAVRWTNTNFTGRAIIYKRTGSSWAQAKVLSGGNTGTGDYFGEGLAMDASGRYVAVGAPRDDTSQNNVGTVSIFTAPDA